MSAESITLDNLLVSVICEEYGISVSEVYERFNKRMQAKGYQRKRR